jgi:biopolymer transport protein ExbD
MLPGTMSAVTRLLPTLAIVASLGAASCRDRPACAPCGPTPACVDSAAEATIPHSAPAAAGSDGAPKLEAASEQAAAGTPQTVLVTITRGGELFVDGVPVATPAKIGELARSAKEREPGLRAVVAADQSATHGAVMAVVDALKSVGVVRIAFAVAPAASESAPTP